MANLSDKEIFERYEWYIKTLAENYKTAKTNNNSEGMLITKAKLLGAGEFFDVLLPDFDPYATIDLDELIDKLDDDVIESGYNT